MYGSPNSPAANRSTSASSPSKIATTSWRRSPKANLPRAVHFAVQGGVRHAHNTPHGNIDSNIAGFLNVPESCRHAGKWSQ
jgi:hypothetical protein